MAHANSAYIQQVRPLTSFRHHHRRRVLSLVVESQLANLPRSVPANAVFMTDGVFLLRRMTPTAFYMPWNAPVLHTQPNLLVPAHSAGPAHGEWPALRVAAPLLDARFGMRARPCGAHIARSVPVWALREAQAAFPAAWRWTAHAQLRGAGARTEVHALWRAVQWIVER